MENPRSVSALDEGRDINPVINLTSNRNVMSGSHFSGTNNANLWGSSGTWNYGHKI